MTRDEWRRICAESNARAKQVRVLHCSTAYGEDKDGQLRHVGFTYRLDPTERAIKDSPRKGWQRRNISRALPDKLGTKSSRVGNARREASGLEQSP